MKVTNMIYWVFHKLQAIKLIMKNESIHDFIVSVNIDYSTYLYEYI